MQALSALGKAQLRSATNRMPGARRARNGPARESLAGDLVGSRDIAVQKYRQTLKLAALEGPAETSAHRISLRVADRTMSKWVSC